MSRTLTMPTVCEGIRGRPPGRMREKKKKRDRFIYFPGEMPYDLEAG